MACVHGMRGLAGLGRFVRCRKGTQRTGGVSPLLRAGERTHVSLAPLRLPPIWTLQRSLSGECWDGAWTSSTCAGPWNRSFAAQASGSSDHPDAPIDDEHVHVGNEVDKLLIQARKDGGVKAILKVVVDHGMTFSADNLATALQQLVRAGAGDKIGQEADWDHMHGLLDKALPHMTGRQLAGILAGLAQLGFGKQGDGLFKMVTQNLSQKLEGLDPRQLVDTVKELRNIDLPKGGADVFGAVRQRATEISDKFTDELKQDLEWAEDTFGLKGK